MIKTYHAHTSNIRLSPKTVLTHATPKPQPLTAKITPAINGKCRVHPERQKRTPYVPYSTAISELVVMLMADDTDTSSLRFLQSYLSSVLFVEPLRLGQE